MQVSGEIFYCGDYVDTDVMSPGRFDPIYDPKKLAQIALIDYQGIEPFIVPGESQSKYKIIVAGRDFGCGSSRETAPLALFHAGVRVIVAQSFARIFFRNCINMGGLYPVRIDHDLNDDVHGKWGNFDLDEKIFKVEDKSYEVPDFGPLQPIIQSGGLDQFNINRMRS
ncbi:MAG: 3-isopropylmalate dehydratase [Pseudomonadota bacterium]